MQLSTSDDTNSYAYLCLCIHSGRESAQFYASGPGVFLLATSLYSELNVDLQYVL